MKASESVDICKIENLNASCGEGHSLREFRNRIVLDLVGTDQGKEKNK